eukprot:Skav228717  [mRNA]  locus=scaffold1830:133761:134866:- [translate_table: standard]
MRRGSEDQRRREERARRRLEERPRASAEDQLVTDAMVAMARIKNQRWIREGSEGSQSERRVLQTLGEQWLGRSTAQLPTFMAWTVSLQALETKM